MHSHEPSRESVICLLRRHVAEKQLSKRMEDLAYAVTKKKIKASNSSDTFTLSFQVKNGKIHSSSYRKLKRNRKTKDDATVKARNDFVQL